MFENYHDVVTVEELGEMLRIGRSAAYALVASGAIPSIRIGRNIRIPKPEVIRYFTVLQNGHVESTES